MNKVMIQIPDSYISKNYINPLKKQGAFDVEYRRIFIGDAIQHIIQFHMKPSMVMGAIRDLEKCTESGVENRIAYNTSIHLYIPHTLYIRGDA